MKKLFAWALLFMMLLSVVALAALPPEEPGYEIQVYDSCNCSGAFHMNLGDIGHIRTCSNCGNGTFDHVKSIPNCVSPAVCTKQGCSYIDPNAPALGHDLPSSYSPIDSTTHGKRCMRAGCSHYADIQNHTWDLNPIYSNGIAYRLCTGCRNFYPY